MSQCYKKSEVLQGEKKGTKLYHIGGARVKDDCVPERLEEEEDCNQYGRIIASTLDSCHQG